MTAFVDGNFVALEKAVVPILDRGFLYGDGVFTTIKVENGAIESFSKHLVRLQKHAMELGIHFPAIEESLIYELIEKNRAHNGIWRLRLIITGGDGQGIDLKLREGRLIITLTPYDEILPASFRLCLFSLPILTPHSHLKTLSYLARLFVMQEAKNRDFDDALVTDPEGNLLEASFSNIFWIIDKNFYTPDKTLPLLSGITLERIEEKAKSLGYNILYVKRSFSDIPLNAHIYCTGSLKGIVPVSQIEDRSFSTKPLFNL